MQMNQTRWPMFNRVTRRADRMDRMLNASNVDIVSAVREQRGEAIATARTKCLHCHAGSECRAWLAEGKVHPDTPNFCPNAEFLEKFKYCRR